MKINIAASHRFHLLDLARELSSLGYDVKFYSYVPSKRCEDFGLSSSMCHCFLPLVAPIMLLQKIFPKSDILQRFRCLVMDYYMSLFMRPCDVYIALGTVYKKSFVAAQKRFGAKTIMEWGSKHIDAQQAILKSIAAPVNKEYWNKRSRDGYKLVDYISIASDHVRRSFVERGFSENKLLQNPYGVDLSMFKPLVNIEKRYDVIMVGGWSKRKGCDLIIDAIKESKYTFLHVGSIVDLPFPNDDNFMHVDAVNQKELVNYYNQAKVFVLPSREEGLAMVQAQAIACNLPLIGSRDSGAEDLKKMVENKECIIIIDELNSNNIVKAVEQALKKYKELGSNTYAGRAIGNLTWKAYGERYSNYLKKYCNG